MFVYELRTGLYFKQTSDTESDLNTLSLQRYSAHVCTWPTLERDWAASAHNSTLSHYL